MIKKFAISSIIAAGLLLACSDVTDSRTDPLSPTASVSVSVRDAVTGAPIPGASVSIQTLNNGGRSTDAHGKVYYDDVLFGDYDVILSKAGYAGRLINGSVNRPTETNAVGTAQELSQSQALVQSYFIAGNAAWEILLPPLTGSIDGTVLFYTDAFNTKTAPAAGAKVRADVISSLNLTEMQFDITADENGYFRFEKLPAGINYNVTVLNYETDKVTFKAQTLGSVSTLHSENTQPLGELKLFDRSMSDFTLVSRTRHVTGSQPIEFIFSDDVETTMIERDDITLVFNNFNNGSIDVKWEGNKLIITPDVPWNVNNTTVTVYFSGNITIDGSASPNTLKSVNGQLITGLSNQYDIEILPENISGEIIKGIERFYNRDATAADSVDWNSNSSINLRWKSLKGVTSYDVYRRYSKNTNGTWFQQGTVSFTQLVKGGIVDTSITGLSFSDVSLPLYEGDHVEFVVIGKNLRYQTKFDGVTPVIVKDELGPKMDSDPAPGMHHDAVTPYYVWAHTNLRLHSTVTPAPINTKDRYGLTLRSKADTICLTGDFRTTDINLEPTWSPLSKLGLGFTEPVDTNAVKAPDPYIIPGSDRTITPFLVWGDNDENGGWTANICYVTSAGSDVNTAWEHIFEFQLIDKAGVKQREQITPLQTNGSGVAFPRQMRDKVYVRVHNGVLPTP